MNREGRVVQFMVTRLRGNATVLSTTGGNIGPLGSLTATPAVSFSLVYTQAEEPTGTTAVPIHERFDYDVEAWGASWSDVALVPLADAIDTALAGTNGTVDGVYIQCRALAASPAPPDVDGQRVTNRLGRRYSFEATGP